MRREFEVVAMLHPENVRHVIDPGTQDRCVKHRSASIDAIPISMNAELKVVVFPVTCLAFMLSLWGSTTAGSSSTTGIMRCEGFFGQYSVKRPGTWATIMCTERSNNTPGLRDRQDRGPRF